MPQSKNAYAPWISDPDPPVAHMSDAAITQAAQNVAKLMGVKVAAKQVTPADEFESGFNDLK